MKINVEATPYAERCFLTKNRTALIWPFINVPKQAGPYELFLDTNAFSKISWIDELPDEIRNQATFNPWPALMEQWLSNFELHLNPVKWIEDTLAPLAAKGVRFREDYAKEQAKLLKNNEAQLKTQWSLLFPYVAIMKVMVQKKIAPADALADLEALVRADVPRFTGNLMLMALIALLKSQQALKFANDEKPAYSYLESFLAFQPGKKDETDRINLPYLRNRSGDLSLWYTLPTLLQKGYKTVGEPVIVTGDKALHRVIFRALPPVAHESGRTAFTISPFELSQSMQTNILELATSVQIRSSTTVKERAGQMGTLFEIAKSYCTFSEEKDALDEGWHEWCCPGFGKEFVFD